MMTRLQCHGSPLISIFSYLIRSVTRPKEIHFIYTTRVPPSSGDIDPQTILFLPRLMDLVAAIADPTNITLSVFLTGATAEGAATDDRGIIEHGKLPNRTFGRRVTEADLVRAIDGYRTPVFGTKHDRQGTVCYVCGPPRMTDEIVGFLTFAFYDYSHQLPSTSLSSRSRRDLAMAEQHIYCLSSIDQSLVRCYIRYCLCFPCTATNVDTAIASLHHAVERLITHLPILAGTIRPVPDPDSGSIPAQKGHLHAQVSLQDTSDFRATVRKLDQNEFRHTYSHLAQSRMPPAHLFNAALTPLPDAPDNDATSAPIFAAQLNVIDGGLLVGLYLHHSIADIHDLGQIIQLLSSSTTATRTLSDETLRTDAKIQSTLRARLSGTWGATKAEHPKYDSGTTPQRQEPSQLTGQERGVCHILAFDLATLAQTKEALNACFHDFHGDQLVHISAFDCVAAILWKAITRATWPRGPPENEPGRSVRLTIPVGIRNRVPSSSLPREYFGNAVLPAETSSRIAELSTPCDLAALAHTARLVRVAVGRITEGVIKAKIAVINSLEDVSEAAVSNRRFDANLVVSSWADLPSMEEGAGLGLGLGAPAWGRKMGRANEGFGCIVLPVGREERVWEVQVTLTEEVMERLLADEGLMRFVWWVA
ncbi:hypothetical protein LTR12_004997 [Friedmanniomyces endolithicus]|nr:hypothetical protein LTR12_004997 [Friedmanniomyces endolithicus]